jgi:hypothetical protein
MRYTNTDSEERRRGMRVEVSRPVKLLEPRTRRFIAGRTRDASPAGLKLELPATSALGVGSRVEVYVGVDGDGTVASRRAMLPARIVWMRRGDASANSTRVLAGIELAQAQQLFAVDAA